MYWRPSVQDASGAEFVTRISNVFVIGKGTKPLVSLPPRKGVRRTILDEQNQQYKGETFMA
jgi:small subunit ribosomal protein S4e